MATMMLKVPGKWLAACGRGETDRVFPILAIDTYRGGTITMVTVDFDGRPWVVHKEMRRAEFVTEYQPTVAEVNAAIDRDLERGVE